MLMFSPNKQHGADIHFSYGVGSALNGTSSVSLPSMALSGLSSP
jgi:hypothetical protein